MSGSLKNARWLFVFPWSEASANALRPLLPASVTVVKNAVLPEGSVVLDREDFALLPSLRRALRSTGVEPRESSSLGAETDAELSDAALIKLWAPKPRGNDARTVGAHPVEERRCGSCDVTGFAARKGEKLKVQLAKAPEDGIVLISNAGGMNALPEPWLLYAMSAELRDALAREGLLRGLSFFDIEVARRPGRRYFGILPDVRLGPMATPYGTNPHQRNCGSCGYVNARYCLYPLYARPADDADWFLAPPFGATSILVSKRVFAWLTGPGRALFGAAGARINTFRAGFWPDEQERAFLSPESATD